MSSILTDKLIFIGMQNGKLEMSYVTEDVFNKLMGAGFIRWDGLWIQHPQLWPIFFVGLASGRCK